MTPLAWFLVLVAWTSVPYDTNVTVAALLIAAVLAVTDRILDKPNT